MGVCGDEGPAGRRKEDGGGLVRRETCKEGSDGGTGRVRFGEVLFRRRPRTEKLLKVGMEVLKEQFEE